MKDFLVSVADVFQIEKRIQEIDPNYRVFFNKQKLRFEVHNLAQKGDTLAIVSPYSELDQRLIRLVRQSRVERAKEVFDEIEKSNEKILKAEEKKRVEAQGVIREKLEKLKKSL